MSKEENEGVGFASDEDCIIDLIYSSGSKSLYL
jgi:hypothetical protein